MTVVAICLLAWFVTVCALGAIWFVLLIVDEMAELLRRQRAWRRIRDRVANERRVIALARVRRMARRRSGRSAA